MTNEYFAQSSYSNSFLILEKGSRSASIITGDVTYDYAKQHVCLNILLISEQRFPVGSAMDQWRGYV